MTLQEQLNQYGIKLLKDGNRYVLYESGNAAAKMRGGSRSISDYQSLINQGVPVEDISNMSESEVKNKFPRINTSLANVSSVDDIVSQYAQNTQAWNNPYDAGVAGANTVNAAGSQSGITLRFKDGSTMQVADMAAAQPFINQSGAVVESGNTNSASTTGNANIPTGSSANIGNVPNGAIIKFKGKPEVYLYDNGVLRHFTREVRTANGRSIFDSMVELDPSLESSFTRGGADISADIPFDPPAFNPNNLSSSTPGTSGSTRNTSSTENIGNNSESSTDNSQLEQITNYINGLTLSEAEKNLLKYIWTNADNYTSGQTIPSAADLDKIIQNAATSAQTDLDPYYQKIEKRELEDLKNKISDIRKSAARYQQQEESSYAAKLASAKQSLRSRGLTFSGNARASLGGEAAIDAQGIEGAIPQERRYNWENKIADWRQSTRDLGTAAERMLGSETLSQNRTDLGLEAAFPNPYANSQTYNSSNMQAAHLPAQQGDSRYVENSDLALERKAAIEKSKWERIKAYVPWLTS